MRLAFKIGIALFLGAFFAVAAADPVDAQEDAIRAKIGIHVKSGDRLTSARAQDRLKEGDLIRIYVRPEKIGYVYVVHADLNEATLLKAPRRKAANSALVMPSMQEFYEVDGTSPTESFTVIVSPRELPEVLNAFKGGRASSAKWHEVETALADESRIDLGQKTEKPFSISGNVRGVSHEGPVNPVVEDLRIFSGKSVLVKRYEFRVKK
jgi:hypothetical protein